MILSQFTKQPSEVKDYDVDYAPWLLPIGDTLDLVTTTVDCLTDPLDVSLLIAPDPPMTTTRVKLWISGGVDGNKYKITIQANTVAGRLDESELVFKVKDY